MRSKDKPRPSMDDSKMASEEPKQDPLNGISMDESDEDFEPLPSTVEALKLMTQAISRSRSVLVRGPVGCGKSFICQHLAKKNGRTRPPDFVTVQLGEHMDGKVTRVSDATFRERRVYGLILGAFGHVSMRGDSWRIHMDSWTTDEGEKTSCFNRSRFLSTQETF